MTDPYKVLGVSPDATDEEIKNAYRNLARKYHPDHYVDNPLADLAQEKMKEINEAYDAIQKMRKAGGSRASYQNSYTRGQSASGYGGYQQSSNFNDIRRLISQQRYAEAEELLDGIPFASRDAEWNFLKGSVCYSKGWLDTAINYYTAACQLSPGNLEYRAAYQRLMQQRQYGAYPAGTTTCDCCEICASIYCCSSCCSCLGSGC